MCDLGLAKSKNLDSSLLISGVGVVRETLTFLASQLVIHKEESTTQADVWAVACVLVELYSEKDVWPDLAGIFAKEQIQVKFLRK